MLPCQSSLASLQAVAVLVPFCASPATGGAVPKLGQPEGREPSWSLPSMPQPRQAQGTGGSGSAQSLRTSFSL